MKPVTTEGGMGSVETIETELALLLRRAEATRRATTGQAHRALDRAAYVILRHLGDSGPVNIGQLADALRVDASTATRQVAAMEREGLLRRDRDPQDGRGSVVSVTPAGARRMRSVREARRELYERILIDWSDDDRSALATLLHRLNQSMDSHLRPS
jgi:DNA-binding MarR family transcriptional regulator